MCHKKKAKMKSNSKNCFILIIFCVYNPIYILYFMCGIPAIITMVTHLNWFL